MRKKHIASLICDSFDDVPEIDADKIANAKAIEILEEIKTVVFFIKQRSGFEESFAFMRF